MITQTFVFNRLEQLRNRVELDVCSSTNLHKRAHIVSSNALSSSLSPLSNLKGVDELSGMKEITSN